MTPPATDGCANHRAWLRILETLEMPAFPYKLPNLQKPSQFAYGHIKI